MKHPDHLGKYAITGLLGEGAIGRRVQRLRPRHWPTVAIQDNPQVAVSRPQH
ncbi:MAG: hypothetical protein IPO19_22540 [Rhodoferax sp.]|nr:hypothetical protein [Rhodoferax sp.]